MKFSKWHIAPAEEADIRRLGEAGYPQLVSQVLAARGISTAEEAAAFLERGRDLTCSPFLMKDMDRAVECISRAISQGRRMAVFGDYDVDGITATVILVDYLKSRGVDVLHYIPRRIEDGYGLGQDAIRSLHEQGVELLITVDCGITGVEEVDFAASLGMDVVITDHHECKDTLPRAAAVVDPHRPDCAYPFPYLAGCGVALKLVLALGGESREEALFSRYCTLAAIGTIADVMPMSGENRIIVSRGLECITQSDFIGLHALLQEAGLMDKAITSVQVGFVLAPRINAAGRMGAADKAADLLLCQDPAEAARLARELCALNRERQAVEQTICAQAVEQIEKLPQSERSALVLASEGWHQGVVGIVASRLSEKYACPSFMIHLNGTVGKGSCRSWGGFNLFAALERCSDLLLRSRAGSGLHHRCRQYPRLPPADEPAGAGVSGRRSAGGMSGDRCRPHLSQPCHPDGGGGSGDAGALRRRQCPPSLLPDGRHAGAAAKRGPESPPEAAAQQGQQPVRRYFLLRLPRHLSRCGGQPGGCGLLSADQRISGQPHGTAANGGHPPVPHCQYTGG